LQAVTGSLNTKIGNRIAGVLGYFGESRCYFWYVSLALLVTAVTSYTNFGHNTGDEYSQIFEFAGYKLGFVSHGDLRLEFGNQMRPTVQVWMVVAVYRFVGLFASEVNPFLVSYLISLLSGLLGLISILIFTKAFLHRVQLRYQRWYVIVSFFSWLVLYTNPHFNSDNIAGHLLLLAVGLLYGKLEALRPSRILVAGFILGLSFSCRFQVGFAILGLMLWLFIATYKERKTAQWCLLFISIVVSVLLFNLLSDFCFYGKLVCSAYNYYHQNIALGIMDRWSGVSPWYSYFFMVAMYLPFGPVYVLATIYFFIKYPLDILTSIIGLFVLFHMLIGHKEVRFLMPMLGFMPVIIIVSVEDLASRYKWFAISLEKTASVIWTVNLLACVCLLAPAATELGGWRYLYTHYSKPTLVYFNVSVNQRLLFYKRKSLQLLNYRSGDPTPCPSGHNVLIAMNGNSLETKPEAPLVYTFFPLGLAKLLPSFIVRAIGHFDIYELKNIETLETPGPTLDQSIAPTDSLTSPRM